MPLGVGHAGVLVLFEGLTAQAEVCHLLPKLFGGKFVSHANSLVPYRIREHGGH